MVFVLTDDEMLANRVSAMNGKERVRPLPRRFTLMDDLHSLGFNQRADMWSVGGRRHVHFAR
jgi:hypothetical protein